MRRPVIALDADGVLLDFHLAYAAAWHRAFGEYPQERDPQAYWPMDRWNVPRLGLFKKSRFKAAFDEKFWSTVPALQGAVEACHRLHDAGYELVCVSAVEERFEAARKYNLRCLNFPIERVIATGHRETARSPKADAVESLGAEVFVDDYLPYFRGIPASVHTALVLRAPNGSPNTGPELELASSFHQDLPEFTRRWLSR
ncbi:HAD family hydrolase [uncultured Piscinibacter sp.]|uniref:HAD family hydrolase n=1 Tax=uncultured Piscinibacter sp. TaxID=1131835 RepID=UPI00260B7C71|nr:HAD family hydrolase [uncultured Piscinibacter sp.]